MNSPNCIQTMCGRRLPIACRGWRRGWRSSRRSASGLFERAELLGYLTTPDPDLHLVVDGKVVVAQSANDSCHTFRLDAAAQEVWLASRCGVPAEMALLSNDRRRLGVCVQQVVLRDDHIRIEIAPSEPSLCEGFHEDEDGAQRWTTGMARVPERYLRPFPAALPSK